MILFIDIESFPSCVKEEVVFFCGINDTLISGLIRIGEYSYEGYG